MAIITWMVVSLIVILWAWWARIPDPPAQKAMELGVSLLGAAIVAVVALGALYGISGWLSLHVGGQPLHL
jgi:hypothetical protein